ncbi:transporter substrate-binding domain-containing protein [Erwinia billingiae]|jgi:octopine/nopaline transport system substrate-binding protein|uniref:Octopine ABC transporter, extracellular solute-binding protein n=1 Tax=Erwinia billingiae (strain Eb661) TaxID=634500 RepID=D8MW12_ERWBE|nr:transporter substrate-binding domain-containing protein [Erwinia billingiae]MBN7122573.1 amino acid ABC transporter substrate-binding protein [Erwinia billingiae]PRB59235.1 amino acid ABC transporter substrate-binding protein [Erwinia billingiae]CAX61019.1 octopine ABC transporter, extracellular solute-binding protein [Erwinia billingiae Eb661]
MILTRKRFLTGAIAALGLLVLPQLQARDLSSLTFATEGAFPPYNQTTPSGEIVGFEPDMIKEIAKRAGFNYKIVAQSWGGMIPGLLDGKYDAIVDAVSITPKRQETINFTSPYINGGSGFVTTKDSSIPSLPGTGTRISLTDDAASKPAIDSIAKLVKGKTIGVQVATIQADFLKKYFGDIATIRTYPGGKDTFFDLDAGRVDMVMAAVPNLTAYVKRSNGNGALTGYTFQNGVLGSGSAIGMRKDDTELQAKLNTAIDSMVKDGTMKALIVKWFGMDLSPQ